MSSAYNSKFLPEIYEEESYQEERLSKETKVVSDDWSNNTKDLLDSFPEVWTRGMLYFLLTFISVVLPWAMLSKVDETGVAKGRLEPKDKTFKLDIPVAGTVAAIPVKEGEVVKPGEPILILDSELLKSELRQSKDKLEGQLNRLSQTDLLKNQLILSLDAQRRQNQAQELEKEAQIEQAQQHFTSLKNSYEIQKEEKLSQVNQAKQTLQQSVTQSKLAQSGLIGAIREVERYRLLKNEGAVPEIDVVQREGIAKDKETLYERTNSDIEQAKLRIGEQQSSYERTIRQAKAEIEQAYLRLKEQQRSYETLTHSNRIAILKSEEQFKNKDAEISALKSEISQTKGQIQNIGFQLQERVLKSPIAGRIFQLPIQRPGAVVQSGAMIAEIAPENSPLIIRAQMPTSESGSLQKGLPVKLKFDAYPFQDYGIVEGEIVQISPTTQEIQTPNGNIAVYNLEIALKQDCIKSKNECIPLRPGDTATAEVIVRQRRVIDSLLDPFKQLQ